MKKKLARQNLTEEQIIAETDKSPGVLLASGYIAGGALAGILVALATEFLSGTVKSFTDWSRASNPLFDGPNSDWLGAIPFWLLTLFLYYVGRELIMSGKRNNK